MPNFRASEWENLFSRNERSRKCLLVQKTMPNFRASECENLFSHNERRRKCGVYEVNAELAQLVEQLIRPNMNKEVWVIYKRRISSVGRATHS